MSHKHHHHHKPGSVSRRNFLGQASCAAVGYTTLFSTMFNLKALNAASINNSLVNTGGDYKALVCLMLSGGNDSFNMLVPKTTNEYNEYSVTRSNLALLQNDLLDLNPTNYSNGDFGVHPTMTNMQSLFNTGKLAFLPNTGALVEPITDKSQYYNGSVDVPLGLYSHSDQQKHWQTGIPNMRVSQGWGGKMADLLGSVNSNTNISMNISLSGSNVFQTGATSVEYSLHPYNGSTGITGYGDTWSLNQMRTMAIDNMIDATYQDIFKKTYMSVIETARDGHIDFETALANVTPFNTVFSDNNLSQSFHMISKVIAARSDLGMSRQIFFIDFGGFDNHDELLGNHASLLNTVDNALGEFDAAMTEINTNDCVTTFGISEFSRTLTSNGNGTDHAWGANVFAMGGAVNGQTLYTSPNNPNGAFPSLVLDGPREIGGGVLIPDVSADEYFAELALWYGVPHSSLVDIFPNIGNFYSPVQGTQPIGFLTL